MLTEDEMDRIVLEAKKSLSEEQIKDAVRRCSYGGSVSKPLDCMGVTMEMKGGACFGKTNT